MPLAELPIKERIATRTVLSNDCWTWNGYHNPTTGYPQITLSAANQQEFGVASHMATVPRIQCWIHHGPPPPGYQVLHSCDNRRCIRPDHLSWGTRQQNNRDAWDRQRQSWGENHHQSKYTAAQIKELRDRVAAGAKTYRVARSMGIDVSYAYKIVKGEKRVQG